MMHATMPQIAQRSGIKVEHICFAARLGRLPSPVGRSAEGLLLFDAGEVASRFEVVAQRGARHD
jgi:hypothetical protein